MKPFAPPCSVSVVVLTHNEELNLPDCLRSVYDWAHEIYVVDSGSTDGTCKIAQMFGAALYEHPFETHSKQWEWALRNLPLHSDWVLALDADQRVTPELAQEIQTKSRAGLEPFQGAYIKRRQVFRSRWIKHGGYYPKYLLKLFRPAAAQIDVQDLVDHHFHVRGSIAKLQGDLVEANRKEDDISFWTEKHNRYAKLLAIEELGRRRSLRRDPIRPSWFGNPDQRVLRLKTLWFRMPLYVRPCLYFFYRYVVRLGFLDGKEGAIFHFLQSFWFRLMVDIHLDDLLHEPEE